MEHDAWFFIGVFVFIFLVWIAIGGPVHPIAFSGPSLSPPGELGGGTYLSFPRASFGIGGSNISLPGSSNGAPGLGGSISLPTLPGGTLFGTASPYRAVVSVSHYVSGAGGDPNNEYVQISVDGGAGVPVDITGWTISSDATGAASIVPKGTELPTSGLVNEAQDIVLLPGTRATIVSGRSPIGASFRENKCIGYFSTFQTFSPPLPLSCPVPSQELSAYYPGGDLRDANCSDYVDTLSRCQVVLSPPPTVSGSCQFFLTKYLHYNGCVEAHQKDADFSGDTWRVYLGRTTPLWRTRNEVVKVLDAKGNTVDAFGY